LVVDYIMLKKNKTHLGKECYICVGGCSSEVQVQNGIIIAKNIDNQATLITRKRLTN
jgi:hypothetical protein